MKKSAIPSFSKERGRNLRVAAIVLIMLNLILGAGLLVSTRSDANRAIGFFDCCRGEGDEAYCCYQCCWFWPTCDIDSDCRDA